MEKQNCVAGQQKKDVKFNRALVQVMEATTLLAQSTIELVSELSMLNDRVGVLEAQNAEFKKRLFEVGLRVGVAVTAAVAEGTFAGSEAP